MPDTLRIRRRAAPGAAGAPTTLAASELAFNENDNTLYYGFGNNGATPPVATSVIAIAGASVLSGATPQMDGVAAPGTSPLASRGDHVHPTDTSRAPLASPVFTGDPRAPTPVASDNDTSIATTAFVHTAIALDVTVPVPAAATPIMDGTAAVGVSVKYAREDHVHPSDTSRAPLASPALTGTPTAPTAVAGTNTSQLATTQFVQTALDAVGQGLDTKLSVKAASTTNLTLSGAQTVDGIALVAGDRVLVKDQSTPADNGIYVVAAGAWTRATDMDAWTEVPAAFTFVEQGTVNADSGWVSTADQGGTLGTTAIPWTQFSGAGQLTAGTGLVKTGNTVDVVGTANRITANPDSIDIAATYVGQTSITTLGTIATGTWQGTTIAVNKGGTGATSLTGYVLAAGTNPFTAVAQIPVGDISGLGTMAVQNANAVAITGGTIDGIVIDGGTF